MFSDTAHRGLLLNQKTFSKATFYKSLYVLSVIRLIKNTTKFKKKTTHTHNIPWKRKQKPFGNASFLNTNVYLKKNLNCKINRNSRNQFSYFNQSMISSSAETSAVFSSPKLPALGKTYSTEIINGLR